jgi:hypothetical protein
MEVAMPRADKAVIVQNELLEGPEGAPKVRVRWYSNGVISMTVLKGSPMFLEQFYSRGQTDDVILTLKPDRPS